MNFSVSPAEPPCADDVNRAAAEAGDAAKRGPGPAAEAAIAVLPAFLKVQGRKVLLVGGGPVAAAKFPALVEAGADVTIIAPALLPALRTAALAASAHIYERGFAPADLEGAWYVVAAAPPEINQQVLAAAEPRCLFVNAVDDLPSATAFAGAIVRRGPVTLAISTGGLAPALAGLLREALAAVLPADIDRWGEVAQAARAAWKEARHPMSARRPLLLAALNRIYDGRDAAATPTPAPAEPRRRPQ